MGIERDQTELEQALKEIEVLKNNYNIEKNLSERGREIYLRIEMMKLLLLSMLTRNESRGAHYRKYFPYTSNEIYKVILTRENDINLIEKEYIK